MAELYFAYGSNMSSARLRARIGGARALGVARLDDFDLVFDKPGQDGTAKANLRPRPTAATHGVLWELEPQALDVLDTYEPGYTRHRHLVGAATGRVGAMGESQLEAWIYLHPGSQRGLAPSPEYLGHLIEGAREHGLPAAAQGLLQGLLRAVECR